MHSQQLRISTNDLAEAVIGPANACKVSCSSPLSKDRLAIAKDDEDNFYSVSSHSISSYAPFEQLTNRRPSTRRELGSLPLRPPLLEARKDSSTQQLKTEVETKDDLPQRMSMKKTTPEVKKASCPALTVQNGQHQ